MTLEEELAAAEATVKKWELAVRFHRMSRIDIVQMAQAGLEKAQQDLNRIKYALHEQSVHTELDEIPWLGDDLEL